MKNGPQVGKEERGKEDLFCITIIVVRNIENGKELNKIKESIGKCSNIKKCIFQHFLGQEVHEKCLS